MNKTKLEVIRINEDVIATSVTLEYGGCYYLSDLDEGTLNDFISSDGIDVYDGFNANVANISNLYKETNGNDAELQVGVWYSLYYDNDAQKMYLYKCSDIGANKNHTHSPN